MPVVRIIVQILHNHLMVAERSPMPAQERLSNHGNGTFGKWCVERCGMTARHARNMIAAHDAFSSIKDGEKISQSFDPSALYALSADTCPEAALSDALKLAKKGEVIMHKRAKERKVANGKATGRGNKKVQAIFPEPLQARDEAGAAVGVSGKLVDDHPRAAKQFADHRGCF